MMNDPQGEKHFVHVSFLAKDVQGEPTLMEPEKCEVWQWFDLNNLPNNVFNSHKSRIDAFLENKNFVDSKVV